jgi:ABC-2 type transport system permease protein
VSAREAVARVRAEARAETRSFLRQRAAVFFTFVFPLIIVGLFGALIGSGAGPFGHPQAYYVPGYLAVVVVLTPLSRVGSTVARHRENRRFEKLATTPLTRFEWLLAHTAVNVVLIGAASGLLVGVLVALTGAELTFSPLVAVFLVVAIALFCAGGALLGSVADSQDGVVAASNAVGIPMVFLADTFVSPAMLPAAVRPLVDLLPLTYFARGVRALTYAGGPAGFDLAVLVGVTVVAVTLAGRRLPWSG